MSLPMDREYAKNTIDNCNEDQTIIREILEEVVVRSEQELHSENILTVLEKPLTVCEKNGDNGNMSTKKKYVRPIPKSLLKGTKSSTARSNVQANTKGLSTTKGHSR